MKKTVMKTSSFQFIPMAIFALVSITVGSVGSIFTMPNINSWYVLLNKPEFITPPNWVFGPVWTTLFALMGISAYLVWIQGKRGQKPMQLFVFQFALNILWSLLFFGLRSPLLGLIGIIVLWIAICATIQSFLRVNRFAAYLLLPYILWVTFAGILNGSIFLLNIS